MGSTPSGISGSRAAAVLGISGFTTRLAVWQEIMEEQRPGWNEAHGYTLPQREETAAMRWGTAFEDAIAQLTSRCLGRKVTHREKLYRDEIFTGGFDIPLTCHIDGMIKNKLYEAKTVSEFAFNSQWGKKNIPAYYQVQVQHNLMLSGLSKAVVVCLVFPKSPEEMESEGIKVVKQSDRIYTINNQETSCECIHIAEHIAFLGYFHQYEIEADKLIQNTMLRKYKVFWQSIKDEKHPTPETDADIARLFPAPRGTLIVSGEIEKKLLRYNAIALELGNESPKAKEKEQLKIDILSWAASQVPGAGKVESIILKDTLNTKLASISKTKHGLMLRRY